MNADPSALRAFPLRSAQSHREPARRILGPALLRLCLALVATSVLAAGPAAAAPGDCGQPQSAGTVPSASDALAILNVSVGIGTCSLCVCDVDASGQVTATDALLALRAAVGLPVTLRCAACQSSTTSSSTSTSTSSSTTTTIPAALVFSGVDPAVTVERQGAADQVPAPTEPTAALPAQ